jgi:hypothetical protein
MIGSHSSARSAVPCARIDHDRAPAALADAIDLADEIGVRQQRSVGRVRVGPMMTSRSVRATSGIGMLHAPPKSCAHTDVLGPLITVPPTTWS